MDTRTGEDASTNDFREIVYQNYEIPRWPFGLALKMSLKIPVSCGRVRGFESYPQLLIPGSAKTLEGIW